MVFWKTKQQFFAQATVRLPCIFLELLPFLLFFIVDLGRSVLTYLMMLQMSGAEYSSASADPVAAFSAVVAEHMNADHSESTVAMVRHFLDLPVSAAEIVDLDQYAMNLIVELEGEKMKARLPFPRPAVSRADIKTLIVECTRAAAGKKTVEK